jgi:hypothetical protein
MIFICIATLSSSSSSSGAGRKSCEVVVKVEEAELMRWRNTEVQQELAALRAELCVIRRGYVAAPVPAKLWLVLFALGSRWKEIFFLSF